MIYKVEAISYHVSDWLLLPSGVCVDFPIRGGRMALLPPQKRMDFVVLNCYIAILDFGVSISLLSLESQ